MHCLPNRSIAGNILYMLIRKLLLCVVFVVCFVGACDDGRVNSVVLVTIDGLSPDQAAVFDTVAGRLAIFQNALTPSPATLPSITSIMTGLHPIGHDVEATANWTLDNTAVTMAEVFKTNNRRTAAFIGASDLGRDTGLNQGFDIYRYNFKDVPVGPFAYTLHDPAPSLTEKAVKWLKLFGDKPYFIWVHYGDLADDWVMPPEETEKKKRLGKVAASVKNLLASLPDEGAGVMVIITAPAANATTHGERGHGTLLYNSTVKVPLYIAGPGVVARKLNDPVSLEDILPTIVGTLNFPPVPGAQGYDFGPLLKGGIGPGAHRERIIVTVEPFHRWGLNPLKAIVKNKHKLIQGPENHLELYDVVIDPNEEHNIAAKKTEIAKNLKQRLAAKETQMARDKPIGNPSLPGIEQEGPLPSPIEKIKALQLLGTAAQLYGDGDMAGASKALEKARAIDPNNKQVAIAIAMVAEKLSPKNNLPALWEQAALLNPGDPMVVTNLALAYYDAGDADKALVALALAFEADPGNPAARMLASDILVEKARALPPEERKDMHKAALTHLVSVIRLDSSNAQAYYKFGMLILEMVEATESIPPPASSDEKEERASDLELLNGSAIRAFESAIEIDKKFAKVHLELGRLFAKQGDAKKARSHLNSYLKLEPKGPGAQEARKILKSLPPKKTKPE